MPGRCSFLRILGALLVSALVFSFCAPLCLAQDRQTYLGFDRNQYPGDEAMKVLRKDFVFTGYWLSPPPGETTSTWTGKREYIRSLGYGFLLLYRGPDSKTLTSTREATQKGTADGRAAAASAKREGFADHSVIFADVEEGGYLIPEYHQYLRAWAKELINSGLRPGVYCSGMPVEDGDVIITTAIDLQSDRFLPEFTFWVYNDACPRSVGCAAGAHPAAPDRSGTSYAAVWQFAQSPRRKQYTRRCAAKYAADGNCYAPSDTAHKWFLDLNSAASPDPSGGAK